MSAGWLFVLVMLAVWALGCALAFFFDRLARCCAPAPRRASGCPCCDEAFDGERCECCGFAKSDPAREARWSL